MLKQYQCTKEATTASISNQTSSLRFENFMLHLFIYFVYFTVCRNPPVLAGATLMTQNPGPYFLNTTVTYECNGNLTTFNSTNRSFINRCVRQMNGSLDWMFNNNDSIQCGCEYLNHSSIDD